MLVQISGGLVQYAPQLAQIFQIRVLLLKLLVNSLELLLADALHIGRHRHLTCLLIVELFKALDLLNVQRD